MRTVFALILLLFVSSNSAWPQPLAGAGAVVGIACDSYGEGIPEITVVLSNEALGIRRTMTTTDDGLFNAAVLPPSAGYRLKLTRKGYQEWTSEEFQVIAGRTWNFKIPLAALPAAGRGASGSTQTTAPPSGLRTQTPPAPAPTGPRQGGVISPAAPSSLTRMGNLGGPPAQSAPPAAGQSVAAAPAPSGAPAAPVVPHPLKENLGDSDTGMIGAAQLQALPSKARQLDELAALMIAVTVDNASGALAFFGDPSSYAILVDGVTVSDKFSWAKNASAERFSEGAMRDVQVLSGFVPTEFGRTRGGFINAVTRSGSDDVHGEAYGFQYKPGLSSVGRYAEGRQLLHADEQGGASVGAPFIRKKLFLFANYEARSGRSQNLNRITNQVIADPASLNVLATNCKAAVALCTAADKFIQAQMNVPVAANWHSETALAKIDLHLGHSNTLTFEGSGMNGRFPDGFQTGSVAPNGGLLGNGNTKHESRLAKFGWTSLPTAASVNELRLSFTQSYLAEGVSQPGLSTGSLGITVAGVPIGASNTFPNAFRERRMQLVDNASLASASHVLKVGVDASRTFDLLNSLENYAGTYSYASLTAFAQDFSGAGQKNYVSFTQQFGNPVRSVQTKEYMIYAEDTWRASSHVTFDIGIRWEKPLLTQPTMSDSFYYNTATIKSTNINLAPRLAVAFKLPSAMTLRLGFGMFHEPHPGALLDALFLGNAKYQTSIWANPNQTGAPAFPKVIAPASAIPSGMKDIFESGTKLRSPYAQQSTFSLERQWTGNTVVTFSAVHSRGLKLWAASDGNILVTSRIGTYAIDNSAGQVVGSYSTPIFTSKADAGHAHVFQVDNGGSSWYNAMSMEVRRRMAHGISLRAHYVWSHAIDDVGGPPGMGSIPWNLVPGDYLGDRSDSSSDQRHRGSVDWVWQPKPLGNNSLPARFLINGWQLSCAAVIASPQPVTPVLVSGGQQISGVTMLYTNSLNGSGGWARVPFYAMSSLRADYQYEVNARLTRTLPFTERVQGALMFEAFNALNRQYTTGVNTTAFTASAAILRPVPGLGAGNASQGYPGATTARSFRLAFRLTF